MNQRHILALVTASLLCSGCATNHLVHLGKYKEQFEGYQAAYSHKGDFVVSYQVRVCRDTDIFATAPLAERWATVRIEVLAACPPEGFTNGIPFITHKAALPAEIREHAQKVPLIHAPVDLQQWPPPATPAEAVKVDASIAIVVQSAAWSPSVGIRMRRADGSSIWIPGGVPGDSWTEGWAYPVLIVGFAPAIAFDIVTSPIQLIVGLNQWMKSITG